MREPLHYRGATALLIVDELEPSLNFFVGRLGFELFRAPGNDYAYVYRGEASVMLWLRTAAVEAMPHLHERPAAGMVYIEVSDIEELVPIVADTEILVPLRKTEYGAHEIFIREPGGNVVAFGSKLTPD